MTSEAKYTCVISTEIKEHHQCHLIPSSRHCAAPLTCISINCVCVCMKYNPDYIFVCFCQTTIYYCCRCIQLYCVPVRCYGIFHGVKATWFIYSSRFWGVHISRLPFTKMGIEWGLSLPWLQWSSNRMSSLCRASAVCGGEVLPWWRMQAHGAHCVVSSVLPWPRLLCCAAPVV